jgi:hypothetical protein
MDHFKGVNETERYNNDLLQQIRKQNELLEQIAQLLQPKVEQPQAVIEQKKRDYQRRK